MSLRNRLIVGLLLLALPACGFEPMYAKKSSGDSPATLVGIEVDTSSSTRRLAQLLKQDLEDKLNPEGKTPSKPMYRLVATLDSTESAIGVARDGTISRYNMYLDSRYELYRLPDNQPVSRGNLRHTSSYNNITNAYYSTYVAREDALKRGVTELSEVYRQRIAAYLTGPDSGRPDATVKNAETAKEKEQKRMESPIKGPYDPNDPFGTSLNRF